MKENHGMYEGDYAAALDILVRAKVSVDLMFFSLLVCGVAEHIVGDRTYPRHVMRLLCKVSGVECICETS